MKFKYLVSGYLPVTERFGVYPRWVYVGIHSGRTTLGFTDYGKSLRIQLRRVKR